MNTGGSSLQRGARARRSAVFSWTALFVLSVALQYATFAAAPPATAASGLLADTVAGFEIDGDLSSGNASTNPGAIPTDLIHNPPMADGQDWLGSGGIVNPADPPTSFIFRDAVDGPNNIAGDTTPDTSAYVGGNKEVDTRDWGYFNSAGPNGKTDYRHVMAAAKMAGGNPYVFLGAERVDATGTMVVDFELNQKAFRTWSDGVAKPDRSVNDVLISLEYSNGGSNPVVTLYRVAAVTDYPSGQVATFELLPGGDVWSATNFADLPSVPFAGGGYSVGAFKWAEAAVNLASLDLPSTCLTFGQGSIRSRTGGSPATSQLKDASPSFPLEINTCAILKVKKVDTNTGDAVPGATFRIAPNPIPANLRTAGMTDAYADIADGGPFDADGLANGVVEVRPCQPGTYTVTEVKVPLGYDGTGPISPVTLVSGQTVTLPFPNAPKTASLALDKQVRAVGTTQWFDVGLTGAETNIDLSVLVGSQVEYRYLLANTGELPLTNVAVTDDRTTVTCAATDLAVGGSTTCTGGPVTLTNAVPDPYTNTATATGKYTTALGTFTETSNVDKATVDILKPDLDIAKTAANGTINAGEQASFTVTVANRGDGTAKNVTLSDPLPGGLAWSISPAVAGCSITAGTLACAFGDVDPGASRAVTVVATTTAATCSTLANTATAAADNNAAVEASASVVVQCPGLHVTKVADAASVSAGDQVGFSITVSNSGPGVAKSVTLTDPLPGGLSWSISPAVAGCSITAGTLSCSFGDLASGASKSVHVVAATTAAACGALPNVATAHATNADDVFASASITVSCPDVKVTKTTATPSVSAGDQVSFAVKVENIGAGTAYGVTVADPLPGGLSWSISPAVAGCSISSGTLACSWASLAPGASVTITLVATSTPAVCGTLDNTATAGATNEPSAALTNNSGTASLVVSCPDVKVTKDVVASPVNATDQVGFTIAVSNSGAGVARNVVLRDALPAGFDWSISPAVTGCSIASGMLTCTVGDMAPAAGFTVTVTAPTTETVCGPHPNTAGATAINEPSDALENNHDSATVVVSCPDVSLTKVADKGPFSAGDTVGFTVTIHNAGPGVAYGVTVADTLPSTPGTAWSIDGAANGFSIVEIGGKPTLAFGPADLAVDGSRSVHIVSATTVDSCGTISNTAKATVGNGADPADATASLRVLCGDITITKVADATTVHAGSQVGFIVTIENVGEGTLKGVTVADVLPTDAGTGWTIDGPANGFAIAAGSLSFGPADLAAGARVSVHIVSPTTRATCGAVDNTAAVTAANDGHASASASVDVLCPYISIDKHNNAVAPLLPGATVDYTLNLTVTDPPLPAVRIVDTLPAGVVLTAGQAASISDGGVYDAVAATITWNLVNVPAAKTLTYTATVAAGAVPGPHLNVARITTDGVCLASCSATSTIVVQRASITKANDATEPVSRGAAVQYTLTIAVQYGPVAAMQVVDELPAGISLTAADLAAISDGGTYDAVANAITWNLANVADGKHLIYTAHVDGDAPLGEGLVNTATITTENLCLADGCSDTSTLTVRAPQLTISKDVAGFTGGYQTNPLIPDDDSGPAPRAKIGDSLTFTLTYTLVDGPAMDAFVTDVLPAGYAAPTAISDGGTWNATTRTITWLLGTAQGDGPRILAASGSVSYRVVVLTGANKLEQPRVNVAVIESADTPAAQDIQPVVIPGGTEERTSPPKVTPPPTSTDQSIPTGGPGTGFVLVLLVIGGLVAALGLAVPVPARARRRSRRG